MKIWTTLILTSLFVFAKADSIYSQGEAVSTLQYDEVKTQLFLGKWPIPSWISSIVDPNDPDRLYQFIHPSVYPNTLARGWKIANEKPNFSSFFKGNSSYTPTEQQLKLGWFYTTSKVSSVPKGWVYSPSFFLFANQFGLEMLSRFFRFYSGSIPILEPSTLNYLPSGKFIRLVFPPNKELAYTSLDLPPTLVLAYWDMVPMDTGSMLFIIHSIGEPSQEIQTIKGDVVHKDGKKVPFLYKVQITPRKPAVLP